MQLLASLQSDSDWVYCMVVSQSPTPHLSLAHNFTKTPYATPSCNQKRYPRGPGKSPSMLPMHQKIGSCVHMIILSLRCSVSELLSVLSGYILLLAKFLPSRFFCSRLTRQTDIVVGKILLIIYDAQVRYWKAAALSAAMVGVDSGW